MYKKLNINILFALLLLLGSSASKAQNTEKWGAVVRFGDERGLFTYNNPTENVYHKEAIKPMFEAGVSRKHFQGKRGGYWFQDLTLGYSHQTYDEKTFAIGTKTGYTWALWNRVLITPTLGVAYNRAKATDLQYAYEGDKWVRTENYIPAMNRLNVSSAMGLGYRINSRLDLTANYQYSVVTNYIPEANQKFNLWKSVNIAVRFYFP